MISRAAEKAFSHPDKPVGPSGETALSIAVLAGDKEAVLSALATGASPYTKNDHGRCPVTHAILNGRHEILDLLMAHDASGINRDLEIQDNPKTFPFLGAPLHYTALYAPPESMVALMAVLLKHGARIDATNKEGNTPLHGTFFSGHVRAARYLLEQGANIMATDRYDNTLAHRAVSVNSPELLDLVLEWNGYALLHRKTQPRQLTPLNLAAIGNNQSIIFKKLLEAGSDPNTTDAGGFSPLHFTVTHGEAKTAILLVEVGGGDVDIAENAGEQTPFYRAIVENNLDMVRTLYRLGANPFRNGADKIECLHAAVRTSDIRTVAFLVEHAGFGAKTPEMEKLRINALYDALFYKYDPISNYLIRLIDDVNQPDKFGNYPLHGAVNGSGIAPLRQLIEKGANPDVTNRAHMSPLLSAVLHRYCDCVQALLDAGADPNLSTQAGSPLHEAVEKNDIDITALLLKYNASPFQLDHMQRMPVDIARKNGFNDLVKMLEEAAIFREAMQSVVRIPPPPSAPPRV